MSYRVQFTISDSERAVLETEAREQGFPNLSELCKARSLKAKNTLHSLYAELLQRIEQLPDQREFRLRDIIETPPTLLGRWLLEGVASGRIPDVIQIDAEKDDAILYRKVIGHTTHDAVSCDTSDTKT